MTRTLRIGCGAGFWGDSPDGPAQIVRRGSVDVLMLDYLAEITMALLARMKAKDPKAGYAPDFVTQVMRPLAQEIAQRGVKVVTNAGGVNPEACRDALEAELAAQGLSLKVALVRGDDLRPKAEALRAAGVRDMTAGAPFPQAPISANAYLGAFPIAEALRAGADIVVTGRCVDSALALGPLIHAFGWGPADFDLLSAGSLAGHVLECGAQATGGISTDWRDVPGWDDMGFPIAECHEDGTFHLTKPDGTGGLIAPGAVAEQITYEVGDPGAYLLPDVACDWRGVHVAQDGPDRVHVTGARGRAPGDMLKASVTYPDGHRAVTELVIPGRDAAARAQATAEAILARSRRLMAAAGHPDFAETRVDLLGAESLFGPHARAGGAREIVLRIAVRHPSRDALGVFAREVFPAATAMAQGITGFAGGRPAPQPVIRLFSCLVPKAMAAPEVEIDGRAAPVPFVPAAGPEAAAPLPDPAPWTPAEPLRPVPLIALARGRSGDKGDLANVAVLARRPEYLAPLRAALTPEAVGRWFAHMADGPVERHEWPGLDGLNFVLHRALGGGGAGSLRPDPQGKSYAQLLHDFPVPVPAAWLAPSGPLAEWAAT